MAEFSSTTPKIIDLSELDHLNKFLTVSTKTILFFWAPWHDPSKLGGPMDQLFRNLSMKYDTISFGRIEAEAFPDASEKFGITVVPTFIMLVGSEVVGKVEGVNPAELDKILKTYSTLEKPPVSQEKDQTNQKVDLPLEDRLKKLVNSAPTMLFMKGSPDAPRCGFSRKTVELLKSNNISFASFDILQDNDVREGLKKLFDWPTYPQLYVKGQLIGGLDILTEMSNSGNLQEQLGLTNVPIEATSTVPLEERLKKLISKAPVMLFMKGSPGAPRCGFSRQICDILTRENISFDSFDILSDEEVRQGLKTLSDWPTYPQLYVKGVLVGGLDIVQEMVSSGSLKEQLGIE